MNPDHLGPIPGLTVPLAAKGARAPAARSIANDLREIIACMESSAPRTARARAKALLARIEGESR